MHTTRKVLLSLLVVGAIGSVVALGAFSAFSSTTSNDNNNFTAGTVTIADNDANAALYTLTNQKPGITTDRCIKVTYTGSLDSDVKLYTLRDRRRRRQLHQPDGHPGHAGRRTRRSRAAPASPPTRAPALQRRRRRASRRRYATGIADNPGTVATKWATGDSVVYRFSTSVQDINARAGRDHRHALLHLGGTATSNPARERTTPSRWSGEPRPRSTAAPVPASTVPSSPSRRSPGSCSAPRPARSLLVGHAHRAARRRPRRGADADERPTGELGVTPAGTVLAPRDLQPGAPARPRRARRPQPDRHPARRAPARQAGVRRPRRRRRACGSPPAPRPSSTARSARCAAARAAWLVRPAPGRRLRIAVDAEAPATRRGAGPQRRGRARTHLRPRRERPHEPHAQDPALARRPGDRRRVRRRGTFAAFSATHHERRQHLRRRHGRDRRQRRRRGGRLAGGRRARADQHRLHRRHLQRLARRRRAPLRRAERHARPVPHADRHARHRPEPRLHLVRRLHRRRDELPRAWAPASSTTACCRPSRRPTPPASSTRSPATPETWTTGERHVYRFSVTLANDNRRRARRRPPASRGRRGTCEAPPDRAACAWPRSARSPSRSRRVVAPYALGGRSYTVMSGSMEPRIHTGDVVAEERIAPRDMRSGDIVTFQDPDVRGPHDHPPRAQRARARRRRQRRHQGRREQHRRALDDPRRRAARPRALPRRARRLRPRLHAHAARQARCSSCCPRCCSAILELRRIWRRPQEVAA